MGLYNVPSGPPATPYASLSGPQSLALLDASLGGLAIMSQYATSPAGGGSNALTINVPLTFGAYAQGMRFAFLASVANTGNTGVTLGVNGLAQTPVLKNGFALVAGDIQPFGFYEVYYDNNNNFQMQNVTAAEYVILSQQVPNLAASIDFTSGFSTLWNYFRFVLTDIAFSNAGTSLAVRISRTGAAPFLQGGADYQWAMNRTTAAATTFAGATEGQMVIAASTSTTAKMALNGTVTLYNPGGTTAAKMITAMTGHVNSGGVLAVDTSTGLIAMGTAGTPETPVNALQFIPLAGTLGSASITGRITMYGGRAT
jgi:hypothetical protein